MHVFGIGGHIWYMRYCPRLDCACRDSAAAGRMRVDPLDGVYLDSRPPVMGHEVDQGAVKLENSAASCSAECGRPGGDGLEGWLHVRRRAGNHTQDLGRRGLLLQC